MAQKYTENKKASNRKWDAANLDRLSIAVPKGKKETIQSAAAAVGQSVNAYINQAIDERMTRESPSNAAVSPSEGADGGGATPIPSGAETPTEGK